MNDTLVPIRLKQRSKITIQVKIHKKNNEKKCSCNKDFLKLYLLFIQKQMFYKGWGKGESNRPPSPANLFVIT